MNDIVLPVSWTTIDERNNKLYYSILTYRNGGWDTSYWILPTGFKSYNGTTLADEMMETMNNGLYDSMKLQFKFNIEYKYIENQLKLEIIDLRPIAEQYGSIADVKLFSNEDLLTDKWGGTTLNKE
jgi:hypothetical protein